MSWLRYYPLESYFNWIYFVMWAITILVWTNPEKYSCTLILLTQLYISNWFKYAIQSSCPTWKLPQTPLTKLLVYVYTKEWVACFSSCIFNRASTICTSSASHNLPSWLTSNTLKQTERQGQQFIPHIYGKAELKIKC